MKTPLIRILHLTITRLRYCVTISAFVSFAHFPSWNLRHSSLGFVTAVDILSVLCTTAVDLGCCKDFPGGIAPDRNLPKSSSAQEVEGLFPQCILSCAREGRYRSHRKRRGTTMLLFAYTAITDCSQQGQGQNLRELI